MIFVLQVWLTQNYFAPKVRPEGSLNYWPPDYDSTNHVPEMPVLTTIPSVKRKIFLVQVRLRTEVANTPSSTRPGSNSWPPDYDSAFHVTEMPALTTRPWVTSLVWGWSFIWRCVQRYVLLSVTILETLGRFEIWKNERAVHKTLWSITCQLIACNICYLVLIFFYPLRDMSSKPQ